MVRIHRLSAHLRRRFGERVQKIPLDAGFSCPNRDGTLSREGCVFCNPQGSGSGLLGRGLSIREQWDFWRDIHVKKHGLSRFTAYLQSYSNTHGPAAKLAAALDRLADLPGLTCLALGTRPDCLDEEKLDLLAQSRERLGTAEVFLELGLQSASDATLGYINRGHDAAAFAQAARAAAKRGLTVVAHVMAGLPSPTGREGLAELLDTVAFVDALPVGGIKFHNVYVCRGTRLARWFDGGRYVPPTQAEYLHWLGEAVMRLDPRVVIHRLNGNPARGELVAPARAGNMRRVHNAVRDHFERHDVWQGRLNGAETGPPEWFDPDSGGKEMTATFGEWVRGDRFALRLDWRGGRIRRIETAWAEDVRETDPLSEDAAALKKALLRYEARRAPDWPNLPLDFSGLSEFQKGAIEELRRIPPGTTRTYGQMAAALGRPRGAQAVGRAMGANPFPVLYPCHRVVGANGAMTGFSASGGIAMKKALLRLEGAEQGLLPGLE